MDVFPAPSYVTNPKRKKQETNGETRDETTEADAWRWTAPSTKDHEGWEPVEEDREVCFETRGPHGEKAIEAGDREGGKGYFAKIGMTQFQNNQTMARRIRIKKKQSGCGRAKSKRKSYAKSQRGGIFPFLPLLAGFALKGAAAHGIKKGFRKLFKKK